MGIGTAAVGWILTGAGYQANVAEQAQSALAAIHGCYTYIPLLCSTIIVVLACFYKLDKQYPEIIKELEMRRGKQNNE